jgi:hypothetical protein
MWSNAILGITLQLVAAKPWLIINDLTIIILNASYLSQMVKS